MLEQRVAELGGVLLMRGAARGERGRMGPTACRVVDFEAHRWARGGGPRWSEVLGREPLQCGCALKRAPEDVCGRHGHILGNVGATKGVW